MRLIPEFWIRHPAASNPVSFWRWAMFKIGDWLETRGRRMQWKAIDPDDDIPF